MRITIMTGCLSSILLIGPGGLWADPLNYLLDEGEPIFLPAAETSFLLSRAEALALQNEPALSVAEAQYGASVLETRGADSLDAPKLMVRAANLPTDSFSLSQEPMTQAVVGVSQAFPAGDTRSLREDKLLALSGKGGAAVALQRRDILKAARLAWLDVWMSRETSSLLRQQQGILHLLRPTLERAYATGTATQSMAERVAFRSALLKERLARETGAMDEARESLGRWFDAPGAEAWPEALPARLQNVPNGSVQSHPRLAMDAAAIEAEEAEAALARQAYKSQWSVDASYGWRDERADFVSLGVTASLPSFVAERNDGKVAAAEARAKASRLLRQTHETDLQVQYARGRSQVEALTARIAAYDDDILPSLKRLKRLAESDYRAGKGSVAAILDATEDLIEMQEKRLQLFRQRSRLVVELLWLVEDVA
ncbi:MAG: TolC family protein [bacterium]